MTSSGPRIGRRIPGRGRAGSQLFPARRLMRDIRGFPYWQTIAFRRTLSMKKSVVSEPSTLDEKER